MTNSSGKITCFAGKFLLSLLMFFGTVIYAPKMAYADCTNPVAVTGTVRYNSDYDVFQGCTSTEWVAFHDYKTTVAPKGCANPGDVCDDGSVYAGSGPTYGAPDYKEAYFFVSYNDAPRTTFNNGSSNWTSVTGVACTTGFQDSCFTGTENTEALALVSDAGSPHKAAKYCYNLTQHGRNDWYLPAFQEIRFGVYANRAAIPNLKTSGSSYYTTSTEYSNSRYLTKNFGVEDNDAYFVNKNEYGNAFPMRCIRRLGCFNPKAPVSTLAYNETEDVFQGCTISGWVKIHEDASGSGCTTPAASPGEYAYNASEDVFQGCTTKGWVSFHRL